MFVSKKWLKQRFSRAKMVILVCKHCLILYENYWAYFKTSTGVVHGAIGVQELLGVDLRATQ